MKYAEYANTGAIIKTGVATEDSISLMQYMGNNILILPEDFYGSDETHYVHEGNLVALPSRPSPYHVFDYDIRQWIDPRTPATQWPIVRNQRDRLLQASDWTQLPDVPLATKEAWAAYRQALRDVTLQLDPFNITWPQPPQ